MPEKLNLYKCVHCGTDYLDELNCIEHENNCQEKQYLKLDYAQRLKKMPLNNYNNRTFAFNAIDFKDLEECIRLCFSGIIWDYDYIGKYEYPCPVIISEFEVYDEYDDFATTYIQITPFEEYLSELEGVIKSLENFFTEEDVDSGTQ